MLSASQETETHMPAQASNLRSSSSLSSAAERHSERPGAAPTLPAAGFIRIGTVLSFIPLSRSVWWAGIRDGRYPAPVKLGPRAVGWRVEDIRGLIDKLGKEAD